MTTIKAIPPDNRRYEPLQGPHYILSTMPAVTIWLITAIGLGLPTTAAIVAILIVVTPLPAGVGLGLLLLADIAIILGGYAAVRRSLRSAGNR